MACLSLIFLGFGCSVGPKFVRPCIEVPDAWKTEKTEKCECFEADPDGEIVNLDHWWEVFEDKKLEWLENWAIENNRNLFMACERIQEARALMGIAAADFYPQITLNPEYTNTGQLIRSFTAAANAFPNIAGGRNVFRTHQLLYLLPFNLSYEIDLWGKIADQYYSAYYNWEAQRKDYEAVMLSLTSDLAAAYFQLRAADAQLDLLRETLKTRKKALEINKARYDGEITFYADVALSEEELKTVEGQLEEMQRQRGVLEDVIATMIGVPASELFIEHLPLEGLPPCIPEGLPSEILKRRPDIAEAELRVLSEHELVKRDYALFFPSLTLTGTGGFESPIFKDFLKWKSRYWMLGVELDQLVFDGCKTTFNLRMQIARFLQASGSYQQQVLVAFQEVEDALISLESFAKQYAVAEETVAWSAKANSLYRDRFYGGLTYYINVVNTERDLLAYQMNVNAIRGFRYLATIQLIKALGGGW